MTGGQAQPNARTAGAPRLWSRFDAKMYLGGADPESFGIKPIQPPPPAPAIRRVLFDRLAIDAALDRISSLKAVDSIVTRSDVGGGFTADQAQARLDLAKWKAGQNADASPQRRS